MKTHAEFLEELEKHCAESMTEWEKREDFSYRDGLYDAMALIHAKIKQFEAQLNDAKGDGDE